MKKKTMFIGNHRLSDIVSVLFLPLCIFLVLHVSIVSRTLQLQQRAALQENDFFSSSMDVNSADVMIQYYKDKPPLIGPPLNNTPLSDPHLLFVTPLLRCGSTSLKSLLTELKNTNGFSVVQRPPKKAHLIHVPYLEDQRTIVNNVVTLNHSSAIFDSFAFIDFQKFGHRQPIHVSLIRSPIERAISWFYHARAPYQVVERQRQFPELKLPSKFFLKKDLETCLSNPHDTECHYIEGKQRLGHTIEFFCGHEEECTLFGSRSGMNSAKSVVETRMSVVGVLEEWNKTLVVLENYVPKFFKGALKLYYEKVNGDQHKTNTNFYKPRVAEWAKKAMKENFAVEQEFYDFVLQRLDKQYKALLEGRGDGR